MIGLYGIVLYCYWKRFSFSFQDSLSLFQFLFSGFPFSFSVPRFRILGFHVRDFASLLLELSIQLFFFPFLFPSYCCYVCPYVVSAVIGCNLPFFVLFNIVFESSFWCIHAMFNPGKSSSSFHLLLLLTRHAGHCWRSKDEIVSDVLLWTPAYGQSKAGRPARTFIQQLCDDKGCNPEDLPKAMNDRETWRERVRDICASRTSWWWWLLLLRVFSHQH